jgi:hypothetical protein
MACIYVSGAEVGPIQGGGRYFSANTYRFETDFTYAARTYKLILDNVDTGRRFAFGAQISVANSSFCLENPQQPTPSLDPEKPHDCINGTCLPQTIHKTPGAFPSLAACQLGCAKNSTCTGECIPLADIAALKQAANKARVNCCK